MASIKAEKNKQQQNQVKNKGSLITKNSQKNLRVPPYQVIHMQSVDNH